MKHGLNTEKHPQISQIHADEFARKICENPRNLWTKNPGFIRIQSMAQVILIHGSVKISGRNWPMN
jgi:hypothetical protein